MNSDLRNVRYLEVFPFIMHPSILFHTAQAVLAPVSIWVTVENGIITGAFVLAIIGLLELFDVLLASKKTVA